MDRLWSKGEWEEKEVEYELVLKSLEEGKGHSFLHLK